MQSDMIPVVAPDPPAAPAAPLPEKVVVIGAVAHLVSNVSQKKAWKRVLEEQAGKPPFEYRFDGTSTLCQVLNNGEVSCAETFCPKPAWGKVCNTRGEKNAQKHVVACHLQPVAATAGAAGTTDSTRLPAMVILLLRNGQPCMEVPDVYGLSHMTEYTILTLIIIPTLMIMCPLFNYCPLAYYPCAAGGLGGSEI